MFKKAVPVFPVVNVSDTIEFYKCKFGFAGVNFGNYAILKNHDVEIHITMTHNKKHFEAASCYILVDNIEDLYVELSAKELIYYKGLLVNEQKGFKEFSILDNNGNILHFGQKQ